MASSSQPDKKRKLSAPAAASGPAITAASHAAFLVCDGRPVRAGPIFHGADTTAALRWCAANQQIAEAAAAGGGGDDGTWMVFALTSITPILRPSSVIRAFLLPAKGEVRELLIPAGRIRETIDAAVIGDGPANCCVSRRGLDHHSGRGHFAFWYGTYACALHHRPPRNHFIHALADESVRGDVVIVRMRGSDNDDPLSIPDDIKPADWKTLLIEEEGDKSAME